MKSYLKENIVERYSRQREKSYHDLGKLLETEGEQANESPSLLRHVRSSLNHPHERIGWSLVEENDRLRAQIRELKRQIKSLEEMNEGSKLTYNRSLQQDRQPEVRRLKQIIEKSYYSIKQMDKELKRVASELHQVQNTANDFEKKYKIATFEREEAERRIGSITLVHRQEIAVLNSRISKLETHLSQLIHIVEQDQKEWRQHMGQLNNLNKFSVQRTYQ